MKSLLILSVAVAALLLVMASPLTAQDPSIVLKDGGIEFPDGTVQKTATSVTASNGPMDLYVDAITGDDENDGLSLAMPKKTIQAAIDSVPLVLGGTATINISDGTYRESLLMDRRFMRSSFARIVLQGNEASPSLVRLDGEGTRPVGIFVLGFSEIRGMEIDGFTEQGITVGYGNLVVDHCRITASAEENSLGVFRSEVYLGNTVITNTLGPGIEVHQGNMALEANTEISAITGMFLFSGSDLHVESEGPGSIVIQGNGGAAVDVSGNTSVSFEGWAPLTIQATAGDAMKANYHSNVVGYGNGTVGTCSATNNSFCHPFSLP
jgi:hypothetical protein